MILALAITMVIFISGCNQITEIQQEVYDPKINPSDFSSNVNNKYFTLTPGKKMIYEAKTEDGIEKIEVYVTHETKTVMGIKTTVVWDRVWFNGELIEDTKDWYAQDKEGNVWYFGEESKELLDGKIISTAGSWESGVDGAKPGIIMKATPKIGETYQQEYYKGKAEDKADILALDEVVTVPLGTFNNCIKTLDYTPLEPDVREHKSYCPEAGGVVLEVDLDGGERVELLSIEYDVEVISSIVEEEPEELTTEITEEKAKEIALREIPGRVTDVAIERKFGKLAYIVEIDANNGLETDVIIDINNGEVLGIET